MNSKVKHQTIALRNLKFVSFKLKSPWFFAYLCLTILSLLFRNYIPADAGSDSPNDDWLGIRLAHNLLTGNWLGNWNNLTLAKPPGSPIYLAFIHFIPLQFIVVDQLIFCIFALYFVNNLGKIIPVSSKYLSILKFVSYFFLIFAPYLYQTSMSRVYRQTFDTIFIFAFFSLCIPVLSFLSSWQYIKSKNYAKGVRKFYISIFFLGSLYALLFLFEADSYWIFVAIAVAISALGVFKILEFRKRSRGTALIFTKLIAFGLVIGFIGFIVPVSLVGQINKSVYGSSLVEDFYSGNFADALEKWEAVKNGIDQRPYVPVSSGQRQALYEISPTGQLMKPYLELPPGIGWRQQSCGSPVKICDNSTSWFGWDMRDAAESASRAQNELQFQTYLGQVARDLSSACESKRLDCEHKGSGPGTKWLLYLPRAELLRDFLSNLQAPLQLSGMADGAVKTPDHYPGTNAQIVSEFHQVANYRALPLNSVVQPKTFSRPLYNLGLFYFPFYIVFLTIAGLGYLIAWRKNIRLLIYSAFLLLTSGICIFSLGIAVFQTSLGWLQQGLYLLPSYALFQILAVIGLFAFFARKTNEA